MIYKEFSNPPINQTEMFELIQKLTDRLQFRANLTYSIRSESRATESRISEIKPVQKMIIEIRRH